MVKGINSPVRELIRKTDIFIYITRSRRPALRKNHVSIDETIRAQEDAVEKSSKTYEEITRFLAE